ncbi:MAG TPA: hypothetical protein VFE62_15050 [Gemmataceae bacterium]|nr:hypothetical protein [Gemmataceae bacterium]
MNYTVPPMPVRRKLLDAVEAMRVAVKRLTQAIADHPGDDVDMGMQDELAVEDLYRDRCAVKVYIGILEELVGGATPTLPERVFRTIAEHKNVNRRLSGEPFQIPHVEGAVIALELADLSLSEALGEEREPRSVGQACPMDCGDVVDLIIACRDFVRDVPNRYRCFYCFAIGENAVDDVLAGRPIVEPMHEESAA